MSTLEFFVNNFVYNERNAFMYDIRSVKVGSIVATLITWEPLPGVLGNKGTGACILGEQGILSNFFQ